MFVRCTWPPRDHIDVRYIYIYIRDGVTIDFIRWFTSLAIILATLAY